MPTLLSFRPVLIAVVFLGLTLAQPLASKAPPQGMRSVDTGGQGRVLLTSLSGSRSATKLAQAVRIGIQGYFDAEPAFQAGVRDPMTPSSKRPSAPGCAACRWWGCWR